MLDVVAPRYSWCPDYKHTLGPEVGAVAALAGFPPDPEQQMLLDAANAYDARTGKSIAFELVVIAPRQNLKTGFFKQQALGDLFVRDERLVVWSAHEFDTSQEALQDIEALIEGSRELTRRVKRILHGASPLIETTTGARMKFKTRTSGGGRGLSGRKVNLDEAFALQAGQTGALYPIMMAQPDPQLRYGSSACRPESAVLWDVVQRGRKGGDPRLAYFEWCAPPAEEVCDKPKCDHARTTAGCGCDKREVLILTHSAITRGRIQLETVIDLRKSMPPDEYAREVMGWHDKPVEGTKVDLSGWALLTSEEAAPASVAVFALAVSPKREHSAIGVAGPSAAVPGRTHLEVVDHRPGTAGVVDRIVKLREKHGEISVALDATGPAESLIEDLTAAGVPVLELTLGDVGTATANFIDGVKPDAALYSHGPQDVIDDAIEAARLRSLGDGKVAFGRLASDADITPLEAISLAAYAYKQGLGTAPTVWSIRELLEDMKRERAEQAQGTPAAGPTRRPDGSIFIPL